MSNFTEMSVSSKTQSFRFLDHAFLPTGMRVTVAFKIKLGFFEKNSHYGDPSSSRTFINEREYHCAKVSFLNKVIFELQQVFFKKIRLSPQEIPTGKSEGCGEFLGPFFFHFLFRKRKRIGHKELCIFNFLSLLITFALKLICAFTWMCLGVTGLGVRACVCVCVCVCVHRCVCKEYMWFYHFV